MDNPSQLPDFAEKLHKTSQVKYGTDSPMQSEEVKQKIRDVWASKSEEEMSELLERRRQTCLENSVQIMY